MAATARVEYLTDAERLREQAAALQRAADRLAEQRMDLLRESWGMEAEADRLEKDTPRAAIRVVRAASDEHDAQLMTRVVEFVGKLNDSTNTAEVADHLAITPTRARAVLTRLEGIGMMVREGRTRATRYRLTTEDEVPTPPENVGGEVFTLRMLSTTHPTPRELEDREIVHTTEAPAGVPPA